MTGTELFWGFYFVAFSATVIYQVARYDDGIMITIIISLIPPVAWALDIWMELIIEKREKKKKLRKKENDNLRQL